MQSRDHNSLNISGPHARVLYTGEEQMLKRQINVWRRTVCVHIGSNSWFCACGDRYGLRLLKPSGFGKWYYPFLDVNTRRCFIAEWSWQSFLMRIILAPKHPFIQPKQILIGRQRRYVMREYVAVSPRNDTFFNCVLSLSWRTSMAISFEFRNGLETCSTGTCSNTNTWLDTPEDFDVFSISPKTHKSHHCTDKHTVYRNHRPVVLNLFVPNNISALVLLWNIFQYIFNIWTFLIYVN